MLKQVLLPAVLFFAIASFAVAAEQANNCKLKGGSMVLLAADACVMEGGAVVSAVAAPAIPVSTLQLSADPKLAAAQRAVAELLIKPVVDKNLKKRTPEEIERTVKFEDCRLLVDEDMQVEHGNAFAGRKHFKVSSSVDMQKVSRAAFGELGKVTSYGGGLETYAIYFEEPKLKEGNNINISVLIQKDDGARKFSVRTSDIYWDAKNDDLWIADEYGYPKDIVEKGAALDTIRILYLMNTPDDAAALNKALGDVQAMCKQ
jgi:membrane protein implicated in regulation of membrane protease activity